ncbi:hypothetical protein QTP88_020689 [Uroleucon formosanum]
MQKIVAADYLTLKTSPTINSKLYSYEKTSPTFDFRVVNLPRHRMSNIIIIYKFDNFFFISVVCTAESDFSRLNYSNNSAVEFIRKRFRVRFLSHGQTDDTLDNIIRTRLVITSYIQ